jgi:oligopeptide/dipeptide ABC transporter ATP-binding protein
LKLEGLKTHFFTSPGVVKAVDGVSLHVDAKEAVGLVGESGCGKTMTAFSILRLIPSPPGRIVEGRALLRDKDLLQLPKDEMRRIRGREIGMVFQDPMTYLNPVMSISEQMTEVLVEHQRMPAAQAKQRAIELLEHVQVPSPEKVINYYPHQLSGGMRQRVLIAMAMSCHPSLLIMDEPTTALDVTVQAQILRLIKTIRKDFSSSVLMITHDLGIVAEVCDRVYVMYAGKIVESADVHAIIQRPRHPYTVGLLNSVLRIDQYKEILPAITGVVPDLINPPLGCRFHPRCQSVMDICREEHPPTFMVEPGHFVNCWLYENEKA